jgi:hypothetical protein
MHGKDGRLESVIEQLQVMCKEQDAPAPILTSGTKSLRERFQGFSFRRKSKAGEPARCALKVHALVQACVSRVYFRLG